MHGISPRFSIPVNFWVEAYADADPCGETTFWVNSSRVSRKTVSHPNPRKRDIGIYIIIPFGRCSTAKVLASILPVLCFSPVNWTFSAKDFLVIREVPYLETLGSMVLLRHEGLRLLDWYEGGAKQRSSPPMAFYGIKTVCFPTGTQRTLDIQ